MSPSTRVLVRGPQYLELATVLLQRVRLAAATAGIWEAADIQWWSRRASFTDRHDQVFWLDQHGAPTAAALRTDFASSVQLDVVSLPGRRFDDATAAWQEAVQQAGAMSGVTLPVRADDAVGIEALTSAGYEPTTEATIVSSWLDPAQSSTIPALPHGFRLMSRADAPAGPHPLSRRNGRDVEERLRRCSLYVPELDLRVHAPDGQLAGYGLFWADPVTHVGLVEPMRTERQFQGQGIARHVLAAGLDRLARRGCKRAKVSSDIMLYLQAGFRPLPAATAEIYAQSADWIG